MTLDNTKVKKWSDLANAFLKQYNFNIDIDSDRTSLMVMENSNKETIWECTHMWKKQGNACTTTFVGERDGDFIRQYFQVPML
jgi:hypothetical protein